MQIAKIAPKVKTLGTGIFDYAIGPEILPQIRPGILVEVPFGSRLVEGVVIEIKRSSTFSNLKKIKKIIDPLPVIDEAHLKLARWMADYYLAPLSQTLFENVVPPAIRSIKKQIDFKIETEKVLQPSNKTRSFLVQSDFSHRLKFYLKAVAETLKSHRSVLILVPDLSLIPYFVQTIKNPIILHAGLSHTQRWLSWDQARRHSGQVVIGSTSTLFAPIRDLGLIIIDQIEDETYKNDRSPRFSALTVAEKLAKITVADLILGSLNPNIETLFLAQKNKIKILKNKFLKPQIDIIDMRFEKNILSQSLISAIEKSIQKKEKIILVLNRKGEGSMLTCLDCGWVLTCESCGLPLKPENGRASCRNCEKNYDVKTICPKCQGLNLKKVGLGTKKLARVVRSLWPRETVINLEKDGDKLTSNFRIAIATSYALKLPLPKIGLGAILDSDSYKFLPDFRAAERDFLIFFKFLKIASRGYIQSQNPDHFWVKALAKLDFENYYQAELKIRAENHFPPFWRMINLIYQDRDENLAKVAAEKLFTALKPLENSHLEILGPSPAFFKKIRRMYRWQIIIKLNQDRPQALETILKKQKGWKIDVDPINLM